MYPAVELPFLACKTFVCGTHYFIPPGLKTVAAGLERRRKGRKAVEVRIGSKEFNPIGGGGGRGWVDTSDLLIQPSPEEQFLCAGAGQSFSQPG